MIIIIIIIIITMFINNNNINDVVWHVGKNVYILVATNVVIF